MAITVTYTMGAKTRTESALSPLHALSIAREAADKGSDACYITDDGEDYLVNEYEESHRT